MKIFEAYQIDNTKTTSKVGGNEGVTFDTWHFEDTWVGGGLGKRCDATQDGTFVSSC